MSAEHDQHEHDEQHALRGGPSLAVAGLLSRFRLQLGQLSPVRDREAYGAIVREMRRLRGQNGPTVYDDGPGGER